TATLGSLRVLGSFMMRVGAPGQDTTTSVNVPPISTPTEISPRLVIGPPAPPGRGNLLPCAAPGERAVLFVRPLAVSPPIASLEPCLWRAIVRRVRALRQVTSPAL